MRRRSAGACQLAQGLAAKGSAPSVACSEGQRDSDAARAKDIAVDENGLGERAHWTDERGSKKLIRSRHRSTGVGNWAGAATGPNFRPLRETTWLVRSTSTASLVVRVDYVVQDDTGSAVSNVAASLRLAMPAATRAGCDAAFGFFSPCSCVRLHR